MSRGDPADGRLDVVGIGSMVLDRMHRTRRILGPNEKGLLESFGEAGPVENCVGGVLLNQLGWASLFGIRTGIFGRQAKDEAGALLRRAMERRGIEAHLDLSGSSSSLAEIFVDAEGERAIYMAAGATAETTPEHLRRDHADFVARAARLSTEVSQLPLDATLEALTLAKEAGLETIVDLDILPSDAIASLGSRETLEAILARADWLKPTVLAARELFPEVESLERLCETILNRYGNRIVVLTDGARGSLLCDTSSTRWIDAPKLDEVVDSTGAGDAFLGGMVAGHVQGLEIDDAVGLGNACGAACVERVGAFPDVDPIGQAALLDRVRSLHSGRFPEGG